MIKKKIGIGTISLLLVIFAFIWSFNVLDFCIGDKVLDFFNIPTWSGNGNEQQIVDAFFIVTFTKDGQSIHYTVFYSFILLGPSVREPTPKFMKWKSVNRQIGNYTDLSLY